MRKIFGLFPILLLLAACILDNSGYPKRVKFGENGGTRTVYGESGSYAITIEDYNGHVIAKEQEPEQEGG